MFTLFVEEAAVAVNSAYLLPEEVHERRQGHRCQSRLMAVTHKSVIRMENGRTS
jgi:hypothetical protein